MGARAWAIVGSRSIHQAPDNTVNQVLEHQINESLLASPAAPVNGITSTQRPTHRFRVPVTWDLPRLVWVTTRLFRTASTNSLQATVRKQFSYGLTLTAAYAYRPRRYHNQLHQLQRSRPSAAIRSERPSSTRSGSPSNYSYDCRLANMRLDGQADQRMEPLRRDGRAGRHRAPPTTREAAPSTEYSGAAS